MENGVEIENAFDNAKIVDMSAHLWPLRFRSGHKRQLYPNEVRRVVVLIRYYTFVLLMSFVARLAITLIKCALYSDDA